MTADPADRVRLGERLVGRTGWTLSGVQVSGMWGEPAGPERREEMALAVRAAVAPGQILEVPAPFGPWADLVRQASPAGALLAVRLVGPGSPASRLQAASHRLGPGLDPALVLVGSQELAELVDETPIPVGAVVDADTPVESLGPECVTVRGPFPAPPAILEWCETRAVPYLCSDERILAAGHHTVNLMTAPARRSTPPAAGPR